ncbi:exported hypothetical protein [Gammaproteobacteria bacterium]
MNQRNEMKHQGWYLGCALCLVAAMATAETPEVTVMTSTAAVAPAVEEQGTTVAFPAPAEEKALVPTAPVPAAEEKTPVAVVAEPAPVPQENFPVSAEAQPSPVDAKSPATVVEEKSPSAAIEEKQSPVVAVSAPAPTEVDLASLRASLARAEAERDEAINHLEGIRADVDAIRQAQTTAQTRAVGLEVDLRAARTRINILDKNVQTGREQARRDSVALADLDSRLHDALDAAQHCGETLASSEGRTRTAGAEIVHLQQEIQNLTQNRDELTVKLAEREDTLSKVQGQLQEREATLTATQNQLTERETTLTATQNQLAAREEALTKTQVQLQERDASLTAVQNQLAEREETQSRTQGQLQEREAALTATQNQLAAREATLTKVQEQIQDREATLTALQNQLVERDAMLAKTQEQLQEREANLTTAKNQLAAEETQATQLRLDLDGVTKERDEARTRVASLETEKVGLAGELEKTKQDQAEINTRYTDLEDRHGQLITTLAPMDGGTLDIKTARTQAAEAYEHYRVLWEKHLGRNRDSTELLTQIEQARHDLFVAQYRVMRVSGGGELYIVRPRDSLSDLARLASRDGSRWGEVRDANAHLLTKTGPLLVGTPLVVP